MKQLGDAHQQTAQKHDGSWLGQGGVRDIGAVVGSRSEGATAAARSDSRVNAAAKGPGRDISRVEAEELNQLGSLVSVPVVMYRFTNPAMY